MKSRKFVPIGTVVFLMLFFAPCMAKDQDESCDVCVGFGPQAPRDIDNLCGENDRIFSIAPSYKEMNLCNIHFHVKAEHKAKVVSIYEGEDNNGHGGGYRCNDSKNLTEEELEAPGKNNCAGVRPGDTIEVHWVYSSCDVYPGEGLGSCFSEACPNPNLRVEAQVFIVVNDTSAVNFLDLVYGCHMVNGYHQAKALPTNTGSPVVYLGSTTRPGFSEQICSPFQVTWSVRPHCAKVDINSLSNWCARNVFNEKGAQGVRKLVTNPRLLSKIE